MKGGNNNNKAFRLHIEANITEVIKYYKYLIDQIYKDHRVFSNYGIITINFIRK